MQGDEQMKRLLRLYKEHGTIVVAVDFDNTLFDFHYEKEKRLRKEYDFSEMYKLLERLKKLNCHIIIWTANEDEEFIKRFLAERNIPYDAINMNPPFFKSKSAKIYYSILLDDAAGLRETYLRLWQFVHIVSEK